MQRKSDTSLNLSAIQNEKAAILVATGFEEYEFILAQKHLLSARAFYKLASSDAGLVTSWARDSWGHNYAVDVPLNQALAADFSICIIPGGRRSLGKLGLSAHTKRFINGFIYSGKPVIVLNDAAQLISELELAGVPDQGDSLAEDADAIPDASGSGSEGNNPLQVQDGTQDGTGFSGSHSGSVVRHGSVYYVTADTEEKLDEMLVIALADGADRIQSMKAA